MLFLMGNAIMEHIPSAVLTLSLPIATVVPYANSLGSDEMPSTRVSPESNLLTLRQVRQYFHKDNIFTNFKAS